MEFLTEPMFWIKVAAVVFLVVLAVQLSRPRYSIRILIDPDGVKTHSGLPKSQVATIVHFLENEVAVERRTVILGVRYPKGYLKIRFRGALDAGDQQKIRNFLKSIL